MKYRKKPVVIDAIRLSRKFFDVCLEFIDTEKIGRFNSGEFNEDSCYIDIVTPEGAMTASEGDWIIKGIAGEFYPCKNEIFEMTYELAE